MIADGFMLGGVDHLQQASSVGRCGLAVGAIVFPLAFFLAGFPSRVLGLVDQDVEIICIDRAECRLLAIVADKLYFSVSAVNHRLFPHLSVCPRRAGR